MGASIEKKKKKPHKFTEYELIIRTGQNSVMFGKFAFYNGQFYPHPHNFLLASFL